MTTPSRLPFKCFEVKGLICHLKFTKGKSWFCQGQEALSYLLDIQYKGNEVWMNTKTEVQMGFNLKSNPFTTTPPPQQTMQTKMLKLPNIIETNWKFRIGKMNKTKANLNIRCSNLWVLLISPGDEYVPENRPPFKEKTSRCINSWISRFKININININENIKFSKEKGMFRLRKQEPKK